MRRLAFTENYLPSITEIHPQNNELRKSENAIIFPDPGNMKNGNIFGTLEFFIQHMKEQFSDEERAMEYYEYAQLDGHREQHRKLLHDAEKLLQRVNDPGMTAALQDELYCLFIERYVGHLKEWDRTCAVFVQKQTEQELKDLDLANLDTSLLETISFSDETISPA
jgi:hemerythrin-like metal-binding protein